MTNQDEDDPPPSLTESGIYKLLIERRDDADPKIARIHRMLTALSIAVALNWLQDFFSVVEMLDWMDGRESGFMSDEFSHDLTVMGPFVAMVFVPIAMKWLEVRKKRAADKN